MVDNESGYLPAKFAQPESSPRSTWQPGTFRLRYAKLAPGSGNPGKEVQSFPAQKVRNEIKPVALEVQRTPGRGIHFTKGGRNA